MDARKTGRAPSSGSSGTVLNRPVDSPARSDCPKLLAQRPFERYRIRVEGCRRRLKLPPVGATAQFNEHYALAPLGIVL